MSARTCPVCAEPMEARPSFGVEIDVCGRCGGVFLDPGEAEAEGVDTAALFGAGPGAAFDLGPSLRPCPAHGQAMIRWRVRSPRGHVDIERAPCCGGVFLDAGEHGELAAAAAHASRLAARAAGARPPSFAPPPPSPRAAGEAVRTASGARFAGPPPPASIETRTGAVFAAPPASGGALGGLLRGIAASAASPRASAAPPAELAANEDSKRTCPRCGALYRADRSGGVEVDVCPGCGSLFFDPGELDARGVDTAALFGVGSEAAASGGPSALACPACRVPMEVVRITTLAGILEVDRAVCCGGLYLDGGEEDAFARAARVASFATADQTYARDGEVVGEAAMIKAIARGPALAEATAAFVRGRVDSMIVHSLRRRQHRRGGGWGL